MIKVKNNDKNKKILFEKGNFAQFPNAEKKKEYVQLPTVDIELLLMIYYKN